MEGPELNAAAARFVDMLTGAGAQMPGAMLAAAQYLQFQAIMAVTAGAMIVLASLIAAFVVRRKWPGTNGSTLVFFLTGLVGFAGAIVAVTNLPQAVSPAFAMAAFALDKVRR